jgi:hypothetical protein
VSSRSPKLAASLRIWVCSLLMNSPCCSAYCPASKKPRSVCTRPPMRSLLYS